MNNQGIRGALPVLASVIAAVLVGCGGGGGDASPPPAAPPPSLGGGTGGTGAQAPVVSSGTMAKGSIILNGIRFDDSATTVTDDRNRTAAQLANGMAIKLRGRSDDNLTGQADRVDVENELRATIQSISTAANTQSFVAGGQTVIVDSQTVYGNVANFAALAVNQRVEVHGVRDADGNVRATRVEAVGAADGADELRGTISAVNSATQFTLNGTVTVNHATAVFGPSGTTAAALVAGALVEVRGSLNLTGTVFTATQIDLEDAEDDAFRGRDGEKTEFEGFVSGFSAHPGTFKVNGRNVQTTASTRFVGGTSADLANNVKVEAEGVSNGGTLVASKVEFRQTRVLLHGPVTTVNAAGGIVEVLGQTVRANPQTQIETRSGSANSFSLVDLLVGECAEIRAYLDGGTLVAFEIKEPSGCGKQLVQARVVAKSDTAFTLTFLTSLNASLANASVYRNLAGQSISRAEFFAAVVPASGSNVGTLVKVKGPTLSSVEEAELQN
jgi:hypothetical protein